MCQCRKKSGGGRLLGWQCLRKVKRNTKKQEAAGKDRHRLLKGRWMSHLRGGIFASMTSAPPPAPPSSVAVQPATCLELRRVMWPPAPGVRLLRSLEAGIWSLRSSPSQLQGCWSSCSPAWWGGTLAFALQRGADAALPPGCWNYRPNSQRQKPDLWVWGAPGSLWDGPPLARPSFFLLSPLQPHRSRHTGLQTWTNRPNRNRITKEISFSATKDHLTAFEINICPQFTPITTEVTVKLSDRWRKTEIIM